MSIMTASSKSSFSSPSNDSLSTSTPSPPMKPSVAIRHLSTGLSAFQQSYPSFPLPLPSLIPFLTRGRRYPSTIHNILEQLVDHYTHTDDKTSSPLHSIMLWLEKKQSEFENKKAESKNERERNLKKRDEEKNDEKDNENESIGEESDGSDEIQNKSFLPPFSLDFDKLERKVLKLALKPLEKIINSIFGTAEEENNENNKNVILKKDNKDNNNNNNNNHDNNIPSSSSSLSTDRAKEISVLEREKHHYSDMRYTYGEISFLPLSLIICKYFSFPPKGLSVLDIGSGSGKSLLTLSLLHEWEEVRGIEIMEGLVDMSRKAVERLGEMLGEMRTETKGKGKQIGYDLLSCLPKSMVEMGIPREELKNSPSPFTILLGDFTHPTHHPLFPLSHFLFCNSTCFDLQLMRDLAVLSQLLPVGSMSVTFTYPLNSPHWISIGEEVREASWGTVTMRAMVKGKEAAGKGWREKKVRRVEYRTVKMMEEEGEGKEGQKDVDVDRDADTMVREDGVIVKTLYDGGLSKKDKMKMEKKQRNQQRKAKGPKGNSSEIETESVKGENSKEEEENDDILLSLGQMMMKYEQ